MPARPKSSQRTFDHMRNLIRKLKESAMTRGDLNASGDAELLGALLSIFVEDLTSKARFAVRDAKRRKLARRDSYLTIF